MTCGIVSDPGSFHSIPKTCLVCLKVGSSFR